jgi:predicted metal-dependent HD superfamily phosphohydrolase
VVPQAVTATGARFAELVRRLGATRDPLPVADELLAAYAGPARAYHGVAHLDDCLRRLDETPTADVDRDRVEAALWFHDAVYDSRASDNEARSGALARETLVALGISRSVADDVARLVSLTDHRSPPSDAEGALLCDIDLSILGRPPDEFDAYDAAIRAEYAWVPDETFRAERARVLRSLLVRNPLYATEAIRRRYEVAARTNLGRALRRLEGGPPVSE